MKKVNLKYLLASAVDMNKDENSRMLHIKNVAISKNIINKDQDLEVFFNYVLNNDEHELLSTLSVILRYRIVNNYIELTKVDGKTIITKDPLVIKIPSFINNINKAYVTENLIVIDVESLLHMGIKYEDIPYNDKVIDIIAAGDI